ncbi:MAG TPA: SDR family NAD(P)-dependent oxidoreductase [Burkholderiales bacterium]|nr:SDR family NAD(P)-dependent oxidoreductase [Burkholderiales bacterium]
MSTKKAFLVSGGSGGIGSAVCKQLAGLGYVPVVAYHQDMGGAKAIAMECGGNALQLDLASRASIMAATESLERLPMQIGGVVLAGSPPLTLAPFGRISADDLWQQWLVHVQGPQILLAELVKRFFRKAKQGTVVGVLSKAMGDESGRNAVSCMGGYIIGKYGLAGVLASLAADYPWLRVCTVKPGYTETRMLDVFDERFLAQQRAKQAFQTPGQVACQIVQEAMSP